jgi:hypothetical protein
MDASDRKSAGRFGVAEEHINMLERNQVLQGLVQANSRSNMSCYRRQKTVKPLRNYDGQHPRAGQSG